MNNIYVEKIPETCEDCEFCEHFGKDAHGKGKHEVACYFNGFLTNALLGDIINAKHCSHLKPLTDRLAEERKKVVQEIGQQLGLIIDGQKQVVTDGSMTGDKTIMAVLDQIERGE